MINARSPMHRRAGALPGGALLPGALVAGALAAGALLARRRLVIVTVRGTSMLPALRPGDRVLVLRRPRRARGRRVALRPGRLVVLERPGEAGWRVPGSAAAAAPTAGLDARHWWVKRVAAVAGDPVPAGTAAAGRHTVPAGHVVVLGEGAGSGDSRTFGFAPVEAVLGTVVRRLPGR